MESSCARVSPLSGLSLCTKIAIAHIEAAGNHVHAARRIAEDFLEGGDLGRPDLAAHQGEITGAGVECADGRGRAIQMVLKRDLRLMFPESCFPCEHQCL